MTNDMLGLKNAKCVLTYGVNRLWTYEMANSTDIHFAATRGLMMITYTDFPVAYDNGTSGWDSPHMFSDKCREMFRTKMVQIESLAKPSPQTARDRIDAAGYKWTSNERGLNSVIAFFSHPDKPDLMLRLDADYPDKAQVYELKNLSDIV